MFYNNNVLKTCIDSFFVLFTDMASEDVGGSGSAGGVIGARLEKTLGGGLVCC